MAEMFPEVRAAAKKAAIKKRLEKITGNKNLYHGSAHKFKRGDIVKPFKERGASATPDVRLAKGFADRRSSLVIGKQKGEYKSGVFKVKPLNKNSVVSQDGKYGGKEVNSKEGFKVVRRISKPELSVRSLLTTLTEGKLSEKPLKNAWRSSKGGGNSSMPAYGWSGTNQKFRTGK